MGAGHYSSPEGGGVGIGGFWFFYDQLYLITPIRLCNILTTPTPPHPAHTQHTPTHTDTRTRTHAHTKNNKKRNSSMWYALNNMHTLTDLCEHVLRWLDYFNRSTLGKSWEMYNFDRCFFSCRRCKKGQFYSDQIICWNMYPGDFHGHYVQLLIRAWKFIYRLHVQVRWAEHIL